MVWSQAEGVPAFECLSFIYSSSNMSHKIDGMHVQLEMSSQHGSFVEHLTSLQAIESAQAHVAAARLNTQLARHEQTC